MVALRCVANLASEDVTAVVIEWSTDYIAVLADGDPELVSIKHREPGQGAWTMGELGKPLRDLHRVWREMDERCRCAFVSNAAVATSAMSMFDKDLGGRIEVGGAELERFRRALTLPDPPLPGRADITAVGVRDMAGALSLLDRDPAQAEGCYRALVNRIATVATEEPPSPEQRIARMTGSLKMVAGRKQLRLSDQTLPIADLRELVLRTEAELVRRAPQPIRTAVAVARSRPGPRVVTVGTDRFELYGPVEPADAPDGSYREERSNALAAGGNEVRLARLEIVRPSPAVDRRLVEFDDEVQLHRTIAGLPTVITRDRTSFVIELPPGSALTKVYGEPPYPGIALDALVRALPTVARTLQALHVLGRAHRALRPDVLLASRDRIRLRDAGLAATAPVAGEGPAAYRAPEQDRPLLTPPGPATDVFQLAAIIFHLATGQLAGVNPPPPSLLRPGLDGSLDDALLGALADDPALRPSLGTFIDGLRRGGAVQC